MLFLSGEDFQREGNHIAAKLSVKMKLNNHIHIVKADSALVSGVLGMVLILVLSNTKQSSCSAGYLRFLKRTFLAEVQRRP